jgi:hypothetical protein
MLASSTVTAEHEKDDSDGKPAEKLGMAGRIVRLTGIEFTQYTSKPTIGCSKIKTLSSKREVWRREV